MMNQSSDMNGLIVNQLSIERCKQYLSHLHALLYLLDGEEGACETGCLKNSSLRLLGLLEDELSSKEQALDLQVSKIH